MAIKFELNPKNAEVNMGDRFGVSVIAHDGKDTTTVMLRHLKDDKEEKIRRYKELVEVVNRLRIQR